MPRPCQSRRASAAAGRNAKQKPAPPIRHKARQKAIHNARHNRGAGPPNTNASGGQKPRVGSRYNPIALDGADDGDPDDDSLSDSMDDVDMYEAENMVINVDTTRPAVPRGRASHQAQVMFTQEQALPIYESRRKAGFPLPKHSRTRYEPPEGYMPPNLPSNPPSNQLSNPPTIPPSNPPTHISTVPKSVPPKPNAAHDYTFDWGPHKGKHIQNVPRSYLIGLSREVWSKGELSRRPSLVEAMKHRYPQFLALPTTKPKKQPPIQPQRQPQPALPTRPVVPPTRPSGCLTRPAPPPTRPAPPLARPTPSNRPATAARPPTRLNASMTQAQRHSETFRFSGGIYAGHALHEVPASYLRTLENNKTTFNMWPEFRAALQDFNNRGRRGPA